VIVALGLGAIACTFARVILLTVNVPNIKNRRLISQPAVL